MSRLLLPGLLVAAALGACGAVPPAPQAPPVVPAPAVPAATPAAPPPAAAAAPRYRCDHGIEFTLEYGADSATVDAGPRGRELLLRDAGGLTPQQAVYSNPRLRAELGLGAGGNEAILRYVEPPLVARCVREEQA